MRQFKKWACNAMEQMPAAARASQQRPGRDEMRVCAAFFAATLSALAADSARAQRAVPVFNSAIAVKMAQACIAYARARNAAVNIWIYNERGELLHFQRMDGAPLQGPSFNSGPQYG